MSISPQSSQKSPKIVLMIDRKSKRYVHKKEFNIEKKIQKYINIYCIESEKELNINDGIPGQNFIPNVISDKISSYYSSDHEKIKLYYKWDVLKNNIEYKIKENKKFIKI